MIWERTRLYIRIGRYRVHKFLILRAEGLRLQTMATLRAWLHRRLMVIRHHWTGKNYRKYGRG